MTTQTAKYINNKKVITAKEAHALKVKAADFHVCYKTTCTHKILE